MSLQILVRSGDTDTSLQFADGTTLILDGTASSLQATLNTLEIFGTLSGLRMNTEKTQMVWIGKRKHCKEKLDWANSAPTYPQTGHHSRHRF